MAFGSKFSLDALPLPLSLSLPLPATAPACATAVPSSSPSARAISCFQRASVSAAVRSSSEVVEIAGVGLAAPEAARAELPADGADDADAELIIVGSLRTKLGLAEEFSNPSPFPANRACGECD